MAQSNDVGALRDWLRMCPLIDTGAPFGVDFLGAEPVCWAIGAAASEWKRRENILGETSPARRQSREYRLDMRGACGADPAENLRNLERMSGVADWVRKRSAAGDLPEWSGGRITAVLPARCAAPEDIDCDSARYRLALRVEYEMD